VSGQDERERKLRDMDEAVAAGNVKRPSRWKHPFFEQLFAASDGPKKGGPIDEAWTRLTEHPRFVRAAVPAIQAHHALFDLADAPAVAEDEATITARLKSTHTDLATIAGEVQPALLSAYGQDGLYAQVTLWVRAKTMEQRGVEAPEIAAHLARLLTVVPQPMHGTPHELREAVGMPHKPGPAPQTPLSKAELARLKEFVSAAADACFRSGGVKNITWPNIATRISERAATQFPWRSDEKHLRTLLDLSGEDPDAWIASERRRHERPKSP
jgi:hypothetical protein